MLLIVLGGAMVAFAAIRFRRTTRDIDAKEVRPGPGERLDFTLVTLLLLLGAILFVYLVYTGSMDLNAISPTWSGELTCRYLDSGTLEKAQANHFERH
jgi:hypothetical protein